MAAWGVPLLHPNVPCPILMSPVLFQHLLPDLKIHHPILTPLSHPNIPVPPCHTLPYPDEPLFHPDVLFCPDVPCPVSTSPILSRIPS